ncbi:glycosyltransferase family 39 protein [PVC group bacterium]|nr:glycosyltransferase family 39 protein [PVC group bacterium]
MHSKWSVCVVILVAVVIRLLFKSDVVYDGFDENIYHYYVNTVHQQGFEGLREIFQQYSRHEVLSTAPSPLRVGYVYSAYLFCKILGEFSLNHLAWFSFVCGLGLVVVAWALFRQLFTPPVALASSLLLITSPIGMALSQRALQDTFMTLIIISCVLLHYLYCQKRTMVYLISLTLTLTLGFLTKESMVLLYPFFIIASLYYWKNNSPPHPLWGTLPFVIAPFVALGVMITIAGNLQNVIEFYQYLFSMQNKIPYAVNFQKGPWFKYIVDFLLISPLVLIFGIIGMSSYLGEESPHRAGRAFCSVFMLVSLAVCSCVVIMNIRHVYFLDVSLRALAVLGALQVSSLLAQKWPQFLNQSVVCLIIILSLVTTDLYQYYKLFIEAKIYDPITANLIQGLGFVSQ